VGGIERLTALVKPLGFAMGTDRLAAVASRTQGLLGTQDELIPIAAVLDAVIDLGRQDMLTARQAFATEWLLAQMGRADVSPDLELVPVAPPSRAWGVWIATGTRHEKSLCAFFLALGADGETVLQLRMRHGARKHRRQAPKSAVSVRPVAGLDQGQESERTGRDQK
jgi:hypothetical protein